MNNLLMSLSSDRAMGLLGIASLVVFFGLFWSFTSLSRAPGFEETLLGKILITFVVLSGVVPWVYLLETSRNKVSRSRFALYFLGCWFAAPLILLFGKHRNGNRAAH